MLSAVSLSGWTHMRALVRAPWEVWQVSFHQQPGAMWLATCLFISSSLSQEFCLATELDTVEVSQGQGSSKNDSHPAPCSPLGTGWSTMNTVIFHARLPGCEAQSLKYWSMQKNWSSPQRGCLTFRGKKEPFTLWSYPVWCWFEVDCTVQTCFFKLVQRRAILMIF